MHTAVNIIYNRTSTSAPEEFLEVMRVGDRTQLL